MPDHRILIAHRLRHEAQAKLAEAERLEEQAGAAKPATWHAPKPPVDPPMTVVRVRRKGDNPFHDTTWWHIRPGQWYPAGRMADRVSLANIRPHECDSWAYVLGAAKTLVDDTEPGERPLTELVL